MIRRFTIESKYDEVQLSVLEMEPEAPRCRAVVQLVHGMTEYKERYLPFMQYLAKNGYRCVMHDHRGHGESVKSADDLGYMYDGGWRALVDDVRIVNNWIRRQYPGTKIVLFGHSMGSLAVRSFVRRYDSRVDALIVCGSPSYNPAVFAGMALAKVEGWIMGSHHRSRLLTSIAFGAMNKQYADEGLKNAWLCCNRKVVEAYNADPKCNYLFTDNGYFNLFGLMRDCYNLDGWVMRNSTLPVLFISGGDDGCRVNDRAFARAVDAMRRVGYRRVSSHLFPRMRHEILNEINSAEVWKYVLDAIDKSLSWDYHGD